MKIEEKRIGCAKVQFYKSRCRGNASIGGLRVKHVESATESVISKNEDLHTILLRATAVPHKL